MNSFAANQHAQTLLFAKSRGTSGSGGTIVQDNDFCGHIEWYADDGVDTQGQVAKISAAIDGSPGADVTPGELLFFTTGSTANTSTERLRFTSAGETQIKGDDNPCLSVDRGSANNTNINLKYNGTVTGQVSVANADFQLSAVGASTPISFYTNGSERARIDSSGRLLIAATSGTARVHIKGSGGDGIKIENSGGTNAACIDLKNTLSSYVKEYRIAVAGSDGAYATASSLFVRDNTAGATRLELASSGDLKVSTGDIFFGTAGKGICLGNTANVDANTLDDYEEGTWTPTVNGTNSNLTHRASRYLKIGKLVQLQVEFYTAAGNFSTGANLNLTNLPFQGPPSPMHVVGSVAYMNNAYGMTLMTNYMNASSQWYFSQATGSGLYLWANIAYETAS